MRPWRPTSSPTVATTRWAVGPVVAVEGRSSDHGAGPGPRHRLGGLVGEEHLTPGDQRVAGPQQPADIGEDHEDEAEHGNLHRSDPLVERDVLVGAPPAGG